MAIESLHAAVRFEVGGVEGPVDGGPVHGLVGIPVDQFSSEVVEALPDGRAVTFGSGFALGDDDVEPPAEGKRPAGGRIGGIPEADRAVSEEPSPSYRHGVATVPDFGGGPRPLDTSSHQQ